jgi:hypothetical protein
MDHQMNVDTTASHRPISLRSASSPPGPEGSLDIAARALSRKRAELADKAEHLARQLDRLQADLAHHDAAIRILCPEARPELIKPKVPGRRGCDWLGRGELGRMVLDTLRQATAPMQVRAIARAIVAAKRLPVEAAALRRVENMVKGALHRQLRQCDPHPSCKSTARW